MKRLAFNEFSLLPAIGLVGKGFAKCWKSQYARPRHQFVQWRRVAENAQASPVHIADRSAPLTKANPLTHQIPIAIRLN